MRKRMKRKNPDAARTDGQLAGLRRRIDVLDGKIVRLLNARTRLAMAIGRIKHQRGDAVFTPGREKEVVQRITSVSQGPLRERELRAIYREIMSAALCFEGGLSVGVWKGDGAGAILATRQRLGECTAVKSYASIALLGRALRAERLAFALVSATVWKSLRAEAAGADLVVADQVKVSGQPGRYRLVCRRSVS